MKDTVNSMGKELCQLQNNNNQLQEYIKCLEKDEGFSYNGKHISETTNRQRTLKAFLTRAETALWFSRAFGLHVESLRVTEADTGKTYKVNVETKAQKSGECSNPVTNINDSDMEKVEQILYLLDKFCVSDEFYHEFSRIENGLPRSYLIKQRRSDLDKLCHVTHTPGTNEGARVSFESLLLQQISAFKKENPEFDFGNETLKIKISGDGAKMTQKSNYILLSCALLLKQDEVMSAKGNHTIAVVNGSEKYETLQVSFKTTFSEINSLIDKGNIIVDGQEVKLEYFLGGDYKFLLTVMGLKGATSVYACLWCKIHKEKRWETDKHFHHFNSPPMMRTLLEIKELVKIGKGDYCCVQEPLLNIDLDHVIVDELHLLLRVMDVMLNNIITEVTDWDKIEDFEKSSKEPQGIHLKKLLSEIRSYGVGFDVWELRNPADNKGIGKYEFTNLFGNDKKKILSLLPENLCKVLQPSTCTEVSKVWADFRSLYEDINSWSSDRSVDTFWHKAQNWSKSFISLRGKKITPYMHVLFAHVPYFLHTHKSLKVFTGQGVERNNDSARKVVRRKSNHFDSVGDILRIENRQWLLRERERASRKYKKLNSQYWEQEISLKRAGKKRRPEVNVPNMESNNSRDTSSSQVQNEQPQAKNTCSRGHERLAKKRKRHLGDGEKETEKGKERVNKQNRKRV